MTPPPPLVSLFSIAQPTIFGQEKLVSTLCLTQCDPLFEKSWLPPGKVNEWDTGIKGAEVSQEVNLNRLKLPKQLSVNG